MTSSFGFDDDFSDFSSGFSTGQEPEPAPSRSGFYFPEPQECMRCGQCLPGCPTYQLTHDEQESPRGRLRIIERLLEQEQLPAGDEQQHLLNCLQCRACETVCPSRIQYGAMFDKTSAQLHAAQVKNTKSLQERLLPLVHSTTAGKLANLGVRLYQKSGLQWLTRQSRVLELVHAEKLERMLPAAVAPPVNPGLHPATGRKRGSVALFTGCIASIIDTGTLHDAIHVLTTLGYDVNVPENQQCCGALPLHQGKPAEADAMISANIAAFSKAGTDTIVYLASACGQRLHESAIADNTASQLFSKQAVDLIEFLNSTEWPILELSGHPATQKQQVLVHEPCTLRNPLPQQHSVYQFLQKIPGLEVTPLAENQLCCGAGGTHMLTHPDTANALRNRKITAMAEQLSTDKQALLVTTNIGCALHLTGGLDSRANVEILHPISLLARVLPGTSGTRHKTDNPVLR